jgi:hypothetical protein
MSNTQANGLQKTLLRSQNPKLHFISFEPLMLKKSEVKSLKAGTLLSLGKKLPQLYVYRKGAVIGQVDIGQIDDNEAVIVSAKERISNLGKPDPKYLALECRIAILPKAEFVVGKLVILPKGSLGHLLLFVKQELIATASLVQNTEGYFLQIEECN